MGVSTYSDFKEIVPDQSEGDFGQKLKDLTEKTAGGNNSGYWREALDKQFNLSFDVGNSCLLYTSPSPRDRTRSRMPSSA